MSNKKVRAVIINRVEDYNKQERMIELMEDLHISRYEILKAVDENDITLSEEKKEVVFNSQAYQYEGYSGKLPFSSVPLSGNAVGCYLSNYQAWNNQEEGYYTIIFNDRARFVNKPEQWQDFIDNLPGWDDFDIIFLSDYMATDQSMGILRQYNLHYSYLSFPPSGIPGIHAYIISPRLLDLLNEDVHLKLATSDYLQYMINEHQLRVMVSNEILFTCCPENYEVSALPRKYMVLFYNKMWDQEFDFTGIPIGEEFELVTDHKYMQEADAVVFHMPGIQETDPVLNKKQKKAGQLWVFWSMECELNYKWQQRPDIQELFDLTMTYQMDSDVPVPYFYPPYLQMLKRVPKPKTGLINAFISSDVNESKRVAYLKELMSYMKVHSYGKLFNNKKLEEDEGVISKGRAMATYKFTIAFENAIAKDYVTEKLFHPLIVGSIPVYLGAPNVAEFLPGNHCYINVNDFASVKDLADYLLKLDKNDELFQQYMNWKNEPLREAFVATMESIYKHPMERVCKAVKAALRRRK